MLAGFSLYMPVLKIAVRVGAWGNSSNIISIDTVY